MDINLSDFDILLDGELSIIESINNTNKQYESNVTIAQLFYKQVKKTPDNIAIVHNNRSISYCQLDIESSRIAKLILNIGLEENPLVAIMAERNIEFVSAVLGILKSGAAYVPVDPQYPKKRIQYMLEDTRCKLLITESSKLDFVFEVLPSNIETVICLDSTNINLDKIKVYQREDIQQQQNDFNNLTSNEDAIAYVIFTSGSTGKPKGVMISNKAVLNTLSWLQDKFQLDKNDVISQKTSVSFTDSVWELFWPLLFGAKMSIFDHETTKDPKLFYEKLRQEKVTYTQFVPSQMKLFIDYLKVENIKNPLPDLKWVFNGGEALFADLARAWFDVTVGPKIANIYGMTESAIYATCYLIESRPKDEEKSISLGKPISNTHVYIMDDQRNICPINLKGEICIGGIGITNGYWNKRELTEKAFGKHPHTGETLYFTGDLGLINGKGNIEYLGRKDDQVQVRGYRVELKEIERVLSNYSKIKELAVVSDIDSHGMTILICYFVPEKKGLNNYDIIKYLKEHLPEYMVPSFVVELEEMPLNQNGKIDRKNLNMNKKNKVKHNNYVPPRNEYEEKIAKIWAEILNVDVESIGIKDSFMEIGGNSISIVRLHRKLKNEFKHEITVAELFSYSTIEKYVDYLNSMNSNQDELDKDLMKFLEEIEDGSIDINESTKILENLKD